MKFFIKHRLDLLTAWRHRPSSHYWLRLFITPSIRRLYFIISLFTGMFSMPRRWSYSHHTQPTVFFLGAKSSISFCHSQTARHSDRTIAMTYICFRSEVSAFVSRRSVRFRREIGARSRDCRALSIYKQDIMTIQNILRVSGIRRIGGSRVFVNVGRSSPVYATVKRVCGWYLEIFGNVYRCV